MILSRAEYISLIESLLPDNSTQEISPLDLRTSLISLIDSVPNFIIGTELNTANFSTPDTRTTKAGQYTLNSMSLAGRSSSDNSAFGYAALRNNYDGVKNTALGTYTLTCNLYGDNNTAVGYQSLVSNITGSGNVGVGNYTLANNRRGDFNIAIGHGAGWYLGPEEHSKLFIGSYAIDSGTLCDVSGEPLYNGQPPLIYGDLDVASHRVAIGTDQLHSFGMLQVSGDVSPSLSGHFNLGTNETPWSSINEEIVFSGSVVGIGGQPSGQPQGVSDGKLTVYGDIVPSQDGRYAIGHPSLKWDGYFNDVVVSGNMTVNDIEYNNIYECLYDCKTLHLATSGLCDPTDSGFHNSAVCGFLSDQALDGAGFEVHSSGSDYRRDYRFIYKFPDVGLSCLPTTNEYTTSRWQSNISLETINGAAFISERLLGRDKVSMVTESGCMGIFLSPYEASGQRVVVAQESHIDNSYPTLEDVNFIARSGTDIIGGVPSGYDYTVMYGTVDSGVKVAQSFSSRIRSSSTVRGFSIVYHDEMG